MEKELGDLIANSTPIAPDPEILSANEPGGGETGGGGDPGGGDSLSKRVEQWARWTILSDLAPPDYARMLDHFGAEIGIANANLRARGEFLAISKLSSSSPVKTTRNYQGESRMHWLPADETTRRMWAGILRNAGVRVVDSRVITFYPRDFEDLLRRREQASARGREILRTYFRVFETNGGFDLRVVEQEYQ